MASKAEPPKRRGKRAELDAWLDQEDRRAVPVGENQFDELRIALAPVSESYLRKLLRESGVALDPMIEGVRQGSLNELALSLINLTEEYERRDPVGRMAVRRMVITAKDHARWTAKDPAKQVEKEEMQLWLLTWLENPPLFPEWVRLRSSQI